MRYRVQIYEIEFTNGELFVDAELDPIDDHEPPPPPPPPPQRLPEGFDSDPDVGFSMLVSAMNAHRLTPIGVQGRGQAIVDALRDTWPGLDVYLSPSDAPVWPGFGSLDVTISSGEGGWSFRPDGVTPYRRDR